MSTTRRQLLAALGIAPIAAAIPAPVPKTVMVHVTSSDLEQAMLEQREILVLMYGGSNSQLGLSDPANLQILREQLDFPEIIG